MADSTEGRGTALAGLRVLDCTQVMAGPFCALQLSDMGADVIKVEPPGGDSSRRMAGAHGTDSAAFNAVNRGKRGVVLDLKRPEARAAFLRLADTADVLIENFRPGVMAAFGLDYPSLSARHPGIIYASISGYGQTGPDASRGGFDLVAQAASGIMSVTGEPGGPPAKAGVPLTDLGAGLFALSGILAALIARGRTGRGQHIDTSLLDAGVALSVWEATEYFAFGTVPVPMGSAHRLAAPYQAVRCADGHIIIAAANDRLFERLCAVLGHPEWVADPACATNSARVAHLAALMARIEAVTMQRSCATWLETLTAHDVPCGPIRNYADVFADPQVQARGLVVEVDHPVLGRLRTLGPPMKLSGTPMRAGSAAPRLGEHTRAVLREAGLGDAEVEALLACGAASAAQDVAR